METFLSALLSGLQTGSIYGLVGLSYVVVFRASGYLVLTQGEMVMLGGLIAASVGASGTFSTFLLAAAVSAVVGAVLTVAVYAGPVRWLPNPTPLRVIILTFGLALILHAVARGLFGTVLQFAPSAPFVPNTVAVVFDRATIRGQGLVILGMLLAGAALLSAWFRRTRFGRAARATGDDPATAATMGIPTRVVIGAAFALGGAVAGVAGALAAPLTGAVWNGGTFLGLKGLVAALAGGVEKPWGPVAGGLVLGLAEQFASVYWVPGWNDAVAFGVLVLVVLFRVTGPLEART